MNRLVLRNETGDEIEVALEDAIQGPGLGVLYVSVIGADGDLLAPEHPYHFDVRKPETIDLSRYVEEPEELPNLPAFLQVEPYQKASEKKDLPAQEDRQSQKSAPPAWALQADVPRRCPKCGSPLHVAARVDIVEYRPVAADGTVGTVDETLTDRNDGDGDAWLLCFECGWECGLWWDDRAGAFRV